MAVGLREARAGPLHIAEDRAVMREGAEPLEEEEEVVEVEVAKEG